MKKIYITTILIVVVLLCSSVSAFDGNRKGFTLGFGLGASPYIYSSNNTLDYSNSSGGLGEELYFGWGIDNKNIFTAGIIVAASMDYVDNYTGNIKNAPRAGLIGANWYHYYKPQRKTWFTVLGLGLYVNTYDYRSRGIGFLFGGGYEFLRGVQIEANYFQGYSSMNENDYFGRSLVVVVTLVAY